MPATKPKPTNVAGAMYARAAECKSRLLSTLIDAELGAEVDPDQIVADATGSGIPFSKVAAAAELLHTRRTRVEAHEAVNYDGVCDAALEESRAAQSAKDAALRSLEAAQEAYKTASTRVERAVGASSRAQQDRTAGKNNFAREMKADAGSGEDPNDWRNITL